ncbi:MAG: hypothetical protein CME29_06705 [Gemmatimonadetes bacterium]|jgi:uncharacterized Ntn-hydrolase superfamily protein|nr:hypothetical protein [Gemmatimonadota bacterium]MBI71402.1 hypothetical protein [Gemmatimonadota bacterium]|tara:strand:- start:174 stop:1028 length:855 start_codon:yes stop_codon:yes gene_type:complete
MSEMMQFNIRAKLINLFAIATILVVTPVDLSATWSVIAVDARTGRVVIASATCVPQARLIRGDATGLMNIQAIVIPGIGVAAAQAGVDRTRQNQKLIYAEMKKGTDPATIVEMLSDDPDFQRRQFGIVDLTGRMAGFSGSSNNAASLSVQGRLPDQDIYFSIQGNILASDDVVYEAVFRFMSAEGTLTDRVMAAMEGADEAGGDVRCTCETEPIVEAPCHGRNAHVAYILAADSSDQEGESFNDGQYAMFIDVTDQNILPHEDGNPVLTLRQRYGAWKASRTEP